MKPIDQLILHEPDQGRYGDCMRATVASLLELPRDDVPHFLADGCTDTFAFHRRVNDFLRPRNLAFLPVSDLTEMLEDWGITGLHHEASGYTDRGTYHAVAALDGKVTHDPHPGKSGLLKVESFGVFVVLDPGQPIQRGVAWGAPT